MLTGTKVNYYFHCKRQCWLFEHNINLEDNSEDVHIGRILHELKAKDKKSEVSIEQIKVDKISKEYVTEIKKSDADMDAAKHQLLYYLYVLAQKGIERKGRLQVIEKNNQEKTYHTLDWNENTRNEMQELICEIEEFLSSENPPIAVMKKGCKRCAYYEYCFL